VLLTLAIALAVTTMMWAEPRQSTLLSEASAAQEAGDIPGVTAKLEAARAFRPDHPRVPDSLARAFAHFPNPHLRNSP
jgi:hypothetical protein